MQLSILVCALHSRDWLKVVRKLYRQCSTYPNEVELCVSTDSGSITSGVKRQQLINQSCGEYVAFVDDDDDVSHKYISTLLASINTGRDVITFNLDMHLEGQLHQRQSLSLHNKDGQSLPLAVTGMTANHLCAWRREVASMVAWCPALGYGDDQLWYKPLVLAMPGLTEQHCDETLYVYNHRRDGTANQVKDRKLKARLLYGSGCGVYRKDGAIYLETRTAGTMNGRMVTVRDRENDIHHVNRNLWQQYKLGLARVV